MPMPRRAALVVCTPMLPDCDTKLRLPLGGCSTTKPMACRLTSLEIIPMQLGPMSVTPPSVAMRAISRSASAPTLAGLGEPGRDGDGGRDTLAPALLEHGRYLMPAHRQESQVGRLGKLLDARVPLESEEVTALGVHRVDLPGVAAVDDGAKRRAAPLGDVARGADHRHRPGGHQRLEFGTKEDSAAPLRGLAERMISASAATGRSPCTSSGLTSISAISG